MSLRGCLTIWALVFAVPAWPAEILTSEVRQERNRYLVEMDASAALPPKALLAVLRDYRTYAELSPAVVEAEQLDAGPGVTRLRLVLRACVLGFCRNLNKLTDVTWTNPNTVEFLSEANEDDFHYSREIVHVHPDPETDGHAIFSYRAELDPKFFVPPLIGPWLIARQIRKELLGTLTRLEQAESLAPPGSGR